MSDIDQETFSVKEDFDPNAQAWNAVLEVDGYSVVIAATSKSHAKSIVAKIKESVWVNVYPTEVGRSKVSS